MAEVLRLNINKASPPYSEAMLKAPWVATSLFSSSTVVKNCPGILAGVCLVMSDNGADQVIRIWDAPSSDTTDKNTLFYWKNTTATANASFVFTLPAGGIEAAQGISVQLVGDLQVIVFYK